MSIIVQVADLARTSVYPHECATYALHQLGDTSSFDGNKLVMENTAFGIKDEVIFNQGDTDHDCRDKAYRAAMAFRLKCQEAARESPVFDTHIRAWGQKKRIVRDHDKVWNDGAWYMQYRSLEMFFGVGDGQFEQVLSQEIAERGWCCFHFASWY